MIRAIVMLLFWSLSTLLVGPFLLLWALISRNVNPLYNVATWLAINGVRLVGVKIVVHGRENLEPGCNYIFMSNHTSNLDPPILIPVISGRCSVLVKERTLSVTDSGDGNEDGGAGSSRSQQS